MDDQTTALQDEWLWGWDPTPGIVSVWADRDGRAHIWRRLDRAGPVLSERAIFRPWVLLASLADLTYLGAEVQPEESPIASTARFTYRDLRGPGHLRYLVSARDGRELHQAILQGATRSLGRTITRLADLGEDAALSLSPEEQYLVATGRTYFRDLAFDDLLRLQFDLETTGLNPARDAIFLVAVATNRGFSRVLDVAEQGLTGPAAEADLIRRLVALIRELDPDVIENHNLHGFDLPFLARRAELHHVPLPLGRLPALGVIKRAAARGYGQVRDTTGATDGAKREDDSRHTRYIVPGRELIDTLDAVRRYDFAARDLPGHGLKAVAKHFGLAAPDREYVEGPQVFTTWQRDPARVHKYATDDVNEAAGVAHVLGGAAFALARMAPRRYERLADAGPATGILDPLIVRAYLRAGEALPAYSTSDGTQHTGAALYLFASGVARRIVKADVSSLYPSLMRQYRISPRADRIAVLLALVDRLVDQRLAAKARAKVAPPDSPARHTDEALSAAMKILVNSAYGYLGAVGLTRLADVNAANEVTRHGRAVLGMLCRELERRGGTLLEADTDGVYFAVPEDWTEADERRMVAEVGALLPSLIKLEYEGRYAAMLSHEPKNYALLTYGGELLLRGVAFRSIRFEPFGQAFLKDAIAALLRDDIPAVQAAYQATVARVHQRDLPTVDVATRVRLTKTAAQYQATRAKRREAPYEAMLANGALTWEQGTKIAIYRATNGQFLVLDRDSDPRNYDIPHYVRLLHESYAARLARAFTADDFATLFPVGDQASLFASPIATVRAILTTITTAPAAADEG